MDEGYRSELCRVRLTEEGKRAMVARLTGQRGGAAVRPRRVLRVGALAAALACLLALAVGAALVAGPVLGNYFGGAGYEQSGALLGRSVTRDGWTMTLTDCVGDDYYVYLGLELTAPEGTALDRAYYFSRDDFAFPDLDRAAFAWTLTQVDDGDPADNHLQFVLWIEALAHTGVLNGQRFSLTMGGLHTRGAWDERAQKREHIPVCDETWDFRTLTLSYPDNAIRLTPNETVTVLEAQAQVTGVEVSPIGVRVTFEGDALKGHHDKFNNGYCSALPEIVLYDVDGNALEPDQAAAPFGVRAGSGCSGGTDQTEPGMLRIVQSYGYLLDLDRLDYVRVCGADIPLK